MPSHLKRWTTNAVLWLNNPRVGWRSGDVYAELLRTQWLSSVQLEELQGAKLGRLLEHARTRVPFYKEYVPWRAAAEGTVRDRLATYPVLTKDAIRACPTAMRALSGRAQSYTRSTTGGTTGEPIEIWSERKHLAMVASAYWRSLGWIGIRPWTKGVTAHGFGQGSWSGRIRLRLANKKRIDGFGNNSTEKRLLAAMIRRFQPAYATGYVSDLLALGQACRAADVKIGRILTTGEMLYDHQRQALEEAYGGKVSSFYGCNEVGSLAYECEQGRLHVADEHVLVEVVDAVGAPVWDQPGRILLTDLDNELMPFIRYEVGDIGILTRAPCLCGRQLTVLKAIEGRTQDALVNEAGDRLSTVFFSGRFKEMKALNCIQLVQRSLREVDLLYEGAPGEGEAELQEIIAEIQARLGANMVVTPKRVDQVTYTQRGKRRLIIGLNSGTFWISP